ncbi:MAG: ATP synthase F1 subunit delta [Prolixibacteraceae bacterium]|jgi:F-type H+-transporting ATPase subunit delta|nr:ATP synthase F1 subunit delta [Prolixibacteraceae bacterium]
MNRNRVTVRYAKALSELALEQKKSEVICRDVNILYQSIDQYEGFENFIITPRVAPSAKINKIKELFTKEFDALTIRFIEMVINHQREAYLKDITRNVITFLHKADGIMPATLKTAHPLSDKLIKKIKEAFEKKLQKTIELTPETDARLIGGFVFTMDNIQYDASLATRIKNIKKQFQK